MDKFKGYLICTDCDGTLTYKAGKVSKENAEAIRYFQSEGGLFTLATGRFPNHAYEFKDQIELNAPIIALNGTLLYDLKNQKIIKEWTVQKEECYKLLQYIYEHWPKIWECFVNYSYESSASLNPGKYPSSSTAPGTITSNVSLSPKEYLSNPEKLDQLFEKLPDRIYKILSYQPAELTYKLQADLKKKFGHIFRFDLSWPEGLEVQPIISGKGVAVQYLKNHLDEEIHTTIGVGDYENDFSLLEGVDISYAVDNAIDSIKAIADRVTVSNKEHALAQIIKELENEMEG